VVIEGPKACGKTATAREVAASEVLFDVDDNARAVAAIAPGTVLEGATPRLLDEWQVVPSIFNHVRRAVDDRDAKGQFILTGSAVPSDDITRHTGAMRITRLRMRPMSLFESGHSAGTVSLRALLQSHAAGVPDPGLTIKALAERVAIGGWPSLLARPTRDALLANRGYLDEVRRVDIGRVDAVRRDPDRVMRLVTSLARNVATTVSVAALAADTGGRENPLKDETAKEYLSALERLMIVEDQPAWAPHLRSRSILRSAPKRHFVDPALAVAAMRATPDRLFQDIEWFGCLFESLVVRDLRIYAQANDAVVKHYRDNNDLEVDAIVEAANGVWAGFEVKLGHTQVDAAAARLLEFARRVDTAKCGAPAVLAVIIGSGLGYVREDGVAVIPIGALGP
jgi:predicted AAA+ superfamily ATPase